MAGLLNKVYSCQVKKFIRNTLHIILKKRYFCLTTNPQYVCRALKFNYICTVVVVHSTIADI